MRRDRATLVLSWLLRHVAGTGDAFAIGEDGGGNPAGWRELRPWLAACRAVQRSARIDREDVASLVVELAQAMGRARRARPPEPPPREPLHLLPHLGRPEELREAYEAGLAAGLASAQPEISQLVAEREALSEALHEEQEAAKDLRARLDCAERGREAFKQERDEHAAKRAEFASEARSLRVQLEEARKERDFTRGAPWEG